MSKSHGARTVSGASGEHPGQPAADMAPLMDGWQARLHGQLRGSDLPAGRSVCDGPLPRETGGLFPVPTPRELEGVIPTIQLIARSLLFRHCGYSFLGTPSVHVTLFLQWAPADLFFMFSVCITFVCGICMYSHGYVHTYMHRHTCVFHWQSHRPTSVIILNHSLPDLLRPTGSVSEPGAHQLRPASQQTPGFLLF